jgi:hypothetical protein
MGKIKDRILLGLISGLIGNIPKSLINEILFRKGTESKRYGNIVSGLFLSNLETQRKSGVIFGTVGDFVIASILGVPLVYLLSYTGKDKSWLKGILVAILGFGTFRGIMSKMGNFLSYPKDTQTNALMSMSSFLWGITTALTALKLGDEGLFKPNPVVLSNPKEDNQK